MELNVRDDGPISWIEVSGCLADRCGDAALGRVVGEQLDRGRQRLLIDLRGVSEVDSTGLAELALAYEEVRRRGARLELLCPSFRLRELLRLSRLEESFPIHCDEQEATRALAADAQDYQ